MTARYTYTPQFGNGAPGASPAHNMPYWDTSTNPFTLYLYHAGAWHSCGDTPVIDATALQGVNVSATPPTDAQVLTFVAGNNDWEPA